MEEDLSTICYCESCEEERKAINYAMQNFPPSMSASSLANYLNVRYEQMRDKCHNKKSLSKRIEELDDEYDCQNVYTIVGFLTVIAAIIGVVGMLALTIWLAGKLPVS